jgi:hypothetical protein
MLWMMAVVLIILWMLGLGNGLVGYLFLVTGAMVSPSSAADPSAMVVARCTTGARGTSKSSSLRA